MNVGLDKYKWYDVTEYETPERLSKCPVLLLAMAEQATFIREEFSDFMCWNVVKQWCKAKIRASIPLFIFWFLVRLTFAVNHIIIAMDHLSLNDGGTVEDEPSIRSTNQSYRFCVDIRAVNLTADTRSLLLYYGIIHSVCIILFDVVELVRTLTRISHCIPKRRLKERFIWLTHIIYRINQFLMACAVITLYVMYLTENDDRTNTMKSLLELFSVFSVYLSMTSFVLLLPYIGFQLIVVHQLISQLLAFLVLYMMMLLPFSTFFMAFINTNTEQGCIEEFRDPLSSIYTSILLMLNMVDLSEFVTIHRGFLLLVHVIFVFVIGILMINFLIAIMTNKAGSLMERQHIMMGVYAVYLGMVLEIRCSSVLSAYYSRMKKKYLLCDGGRYYVIDLERFVGCMRVSRSEKDTKCRDD